MMDDKELLNALAKGDVEYLGELYQKYGDMVYRTALGILKDPVASQDIMHDVFMKLTRNPTKINNLPSYLWSMTKNSSYDHLKRISKRVSYDDAIVPDSIQITEAFDESNLVLKAISELPAHQRTVFILHYINGLSIQEIALHLELPEGTVKSRLHYGRKRFKKRLTSLYTNELDYYGPKDEFE